MDKILKLKYDDISSAPFRNTAELCDKCFTKISKTDDRLVHLVEKRKLCTKCYESK